MLLVISPASAGIYKWTDSDGNIHFGDKPVDSSSATELNIRTDKTGVTNSSGNSEEREYLLKKIEEDDQADAKNRKKRLAADKKRRKRCDSYKIRYQKHIQSNRTYRMSPDGERTYLSDKQRAKKKKELSKGVSKYCG